MDETTTLAKRLVTIILVLCSQSALASKPAIKLERSSTLPQHTDDLQAIRSGDTVMSLLARHGFASLNREKLISESGLPRDFKLIPQEHYLVSYDPQKKLSEVRFFDTHSDRTYVFWRKDHNRAGGELQVMPFETRIKEVSGRVIGSLYGSLMSAVPSPWVATRFLDAYAFERDSATDLQKGARFGMQVEEKYWRGQFVKYGEVLKTSLEINGALKDYQFLRVGLGGVFVDRKLREQRRPLYSPVPYLRISSTFQPRRMHPIRKRIQPHLGTDFELAGGTPVFAAQDGVVASFGRSRASGNYVVLRHSDGFESSYSHLASYPSHLFVGKTIHAGQKVGEAGCTGFCTMPHLHFAVKRYGQWLDPMYAIKSYPYAYEEQVLEHVAEMRKSVARAR